MSSDIFQDIISSSALELVTAVLTKSTNLARMLSATYCDPDPNPTSSMPPRTNVPLPARRHPFPLPLLSSPRGPDRAHLSLSGGKTQFLYFLTMTTILPPELLLFPEGDMVLLGGRGKSVIVLDCDNRWDVTRLAEHLEHHIRLRISLTPGIDSTSLPADTVPTAVRAALRKLHLFRPTSTLSLAATLQGLPAYHREKMKTEEMWEMERSRIAWEDHPMRHVTSALDMLRKEYGVVVWMTTQNLFPHRRETSTAMHHRSFIPEPTYLITLTKTPTPPYPPEIKVAQAMSDVPRKASVKEACVKGTVRERGISFDYGIEPHGLRVES